MLRNLTSKVTCLYSMRLKGPRSQRQAIKRNELYVKQDVPEDFFKSYYNNTLHIYKSNFTVEELGDSNQMVRRVFSLQNATPSEILKYRISQAVTKYQISPTDVGSAGVQVSSMSQRIIFMMIHTKKYPKDIKGGRYLNQLIDQRRKMMNYLMRTDYHRYKWICIDYGIPEVHPKNAHHQTNFRWKSNPTTGY